MNPLFVFALHFLRKIFKMTDLKKEGKIYRSRLILYYDFSGCLERVLR